LGLLNEEQITSLINKFIKHKALKKAYLKMTLLAGLVTVGALLMDGGMDESFKSIQLAQNKSATLH
jgi:hypothetical protein